MANPIEYIVFEPDQVLTNDHLNETFDYLDQQNRWTRNKLIGIGIVCGLDIVLNPGVIEITKGCGVTSQGYLITQDTTDYTWYMPYAAIAPPLDPPFVYPYGNLPFYKPFCTAAKNPVYLLITDDQHDALDGDTSAVSTVSSATVGFLDDYAVVLFLEANEMDLKNCDTQDCNNKGRKMTFQVRPLLVAKADLPVIGQGNTQPSPDLNLPHQIKFTRYNVPYTNLNNTDDILNAFKNIVTDTLLTEVTNAYKYCYAKYSAILKYSAPPFDALLTTLQGYRDQILSQNPIFIEYFYDFIDDLIKAWYEFSVKVSGIISTCCPDENLFPLHLVLGGASQATSSYASDSYRTYFIYSPLFSKMGSESSEIVFLFNRMVIMTQQFTIQVQQASSFQTFDNIATFPKSSPIKITPSQYEYPWLSERAIPYYYNVNVSGSELYKTWNYYKTMHGSAAFNLGYNAYMYNTNTAVTDPLLYDIEHYNFFRVEGHIGLNYQTVLSDILSQRQKYNLPFDVVTISADLLTSNAALPQCNFQDLETDYALILGEAACKIHLNFCFISSLPFAGNNIYVIGKTELTPVDNAINYSQFKINALSLPEEAIAIYLKYKKGDFMRQYCAAQPNTIGSAYLLAISTGVFINPVPIPTDATTVTPMILVYHYFFEFIDSVEEMMYVLHTNTVADIDMTTFGITYQTYLVDVLWTMASLVSASEANATEQQANVFAEAYQLGVLAEELGVLTSICIDERLQVLKDEYTRRLKLYQQQHTFLNYYQKHPGLEHKAGVPKGGTLVLVYHTQTGKRIIERDALTQVTLVREEQLPATSYFNATDIALIRNFVNECQDAPADQKQQLIDILAKKPPAPKPTYQVSNNVVIADFYIPYLCCSDCPPIAYIMPAPVVDQTYTVTGSGSFCAGGTGVDVGLTGSDIGSSYQLNINGAAASIAPLPGKGSALDFGPQTIDGVYTVVATDASGTTTNMNGSATVTVIPIPTAFEVTGGGPICDGSSTAIPIGLSGSENNVNYQLLNSAGTVVATATGTGGVINFNPQTAAGNYTVTALTVTGSCPATMTGSATITTAPMPKNSDVSTKPPLLTPNTIGFAIVVALSEISTQYDLQLNGETITSKTGTGTLLSFQVPSYVPGVYTIVVTNKAGCSITINVPIKMGK